MALLIVKAYCAGIPVFEKRVEKKDLDDFMKSSKEEWKEGVFQISFGSRQVARASELCLDVYEYETGTFRFDLSKAFKP